MQARGSSSTEVGQAQRMSETKDVVVTEIEDRNDQILKLRERLEMLQIEEAQLAVRTLNADADYKIRVAVTGNKSKGNTVQDQYNAKKAEVIHPQAMLSTFLSLPTRIIVVLHWRDTR